VVDHAAARLRQAAAGNDVQPLSIRSFAR
jgi:hypothetical protein